MNTQSKNSFNIKIFPIFIIVFLGFLGFSLPFPLFSPMILHEKYGFISPGYSVEIKSIFLGILLAMYPLGQLFGCPFFGQLSDQFGRRKILLITLFLTFFSYIASAVAVTFSHFFFLVLSRFFCGVFEGNIVIANSAVADISDERTKTKNFGYVSVATSLGFVVGPIMGGKLADGQSVSWFNLALPFWGVSLFVLITIGVVYLFFQETFLEKKKEKVKWFLGFSQLYRGLFIPQLRTIYLINFFLYFGMFCYFNYLPLFLLDQFSFGPSELSWVTSYVSLPIAISSLFIVGALSKKFQTRISTAFAGLFFGISMIIMILPKSPYSLFWTIFLIGIFLGICLTNMVVMVSDRIDADSQGMALGINQSVQVLSEVMAAILGGMLAIICSSCPLVVGAIISSLAALFLLSPKIKNISY